MPTATVPKTPVHKNDYPRLTKDEVWFSEHRWMASPADYAVVSQQPREGDFCAFVASCANPGHDIGAFRFGEDVRHFEMTMSFSVNLESMRPPATLP